jgi:hypothetical protein
MNKGYLFSFGLVLAFTQNQSTPAHAGLMAEEIDCPRPQDVVLTPGDSVSRPHKFNLTFSAQTVTAHELKTSQGTTAIFQVSPSHFQINCVYDNFILSTKLDNYQSCATYNGYVDGRFMCIPNPPSPIRISTGIALPVGSITAAPPAAPTSLGTSTFVPKPSTTGTPIIIIPATTYY